nr:hypothetical protein [Candidatus Methanomethylophilus sp. 1R26]
MRRKCSLTVALPIISAAGVECSALPTAVLSTHTGGFKGYTFRDLTDDIEPILAHWKSLNVRFDGVYTGYLGSARQVALVEEIFAYAKGNGAQIFVDPVMADDGKMYPGFDMSFAKGMRDLCTRADALCRTSPRRCSCSARSTGRARTRKSTSKGCSGASPRSARRRSSSPACTSTA